MKENLSLIILFFSVVAGFISIFLTSIGTLIILGGAVIYAWMNGFVVLTLKDLAFLFVFYLMGEGIESLATILGAKKFGASNKAVIGAMIGGFFGAIFGSALLGAGIFPGTLLGIFLGAVLVEFLSHKDFTRSIKAGAGGVVGRLIAIVGKVFIALAMIGFIIRSIF